MWSGDGGPIWSDGPLWFDAPMVTVLFLGHGVALLGRGSWFWSWFWVIDGRGSCCWVTDGPIAGGSSWWWWILFLGHSCSLVFSRRSMIWSDWDWFWFWFFLLLLIRCGCGRCGCGGCGGWILMLIWFDCYWFLFGPTVDVYVDGVDVDGVGVLGGCEGFFFFFPLLLFVIMVDLAGGWRRQLWVDVMVVVGVGGCGGWRWWE